MLLNSIYRRTACKRNPRTYTLDLLPPFLTILDQLWWRRHVIIDQMVDRSFIFLNHWVGLFATWRSGFTEQVL
ncbi:hypothetical protein Hanom_Chr02g00176361 [Helianthus anomalus]